METIWTVSNRTVSNRISDDSIKKVPYIGTYKVFTKSASEEEIERTWNEMRALLIKSNLMEPK